jgi:hypothetical protein
MQKIPLQLARAEMVLAKPVTRENGMVLVAAGTVLTESLISKLGNMGVEEVAVQGDALGMGDGCGAEALAKKQERLEHLFRNFKEDAYMQHVKGLITEYYTRKCALAAAAQASRGEGQ